MLVKRDINQHRSVKVKVGAVSTCPIPSIQISFIISQPCNQLNCIGQQCNLMGMYRCTVQPCGMYYETMLLFEVNHATNCEHLLNQTPYTCKIYVLFATPFKMGRFEILVPPAKSEMETENLSVSARQGWGNPTYRKILQNSFRSNIHGLRTMLVVRFLNRIPLL